MRGETVDMSYLLGILPGTSSEDNKYEPRIRVTQLVFESMAKSKNPMQWTIRLNSCLAGTDEDRGIWNCKTTGFSDSLTAYQGIPVHTGIQHP